MCMSVAWNTKVCLISIGFDAANKGYFSKIYTTSDCTCENKVGKY